MPTQGQYAHIKGGSAPDLGPTRFRSSWERNLARVLHYLKEQQTIIAWGYEQQSKFYFPGVGKTGNYSVTWDFWVAWLDKRGRFHLTYADTKGRLKTGGRLSHLDLTPLNKAADSDSRIKGERFHLYYPDRDVFYIGQREYRWLQRRFAPLVNWETPTRTPSPKKAKARAKAKAKTSVRTAA